MFQDWIGREEVATQRADGWPIRGLCALLGREDRSHEGAAIPNAGHWAYFTPAVATTPPRHRRPSQAGWAVAAFSSGAADVGWQ